MRVTMPPVLRKPARVIFNGFNGLAALSLVPCVAAWNRSPVRVREGMKDVLWKVLILLLINSAWVPAFAGAHVAGYAAWQCRASARWVVAARVAGFVAGLYLPVGLVVGMAVRHEDERRRRALLNLCPACGYDLRATPGRCPECGRAATTRE